MMALSPRFAPGCLSELRLDTLLADELEGESARLARSHIEQCEACARRLEARVAERSRVGEELDAGRWKVPASAQAANVSRSRAWWPRWVWGGAGLLAAAAALLLFARPAPPHIDDGVRAKGSSPSLTYWVLRDGAVLDAASAGTLHPGDSIRFAYDWSSDGYLALLSKDGSGGVSVYSPDPERMWPARSGAGQLLPEALLLDDTAGPEQVHALFCSQPLDLADLRTSLQRSDTVTAPGCRVLVLSLPKAAR